MGNAPLPYREYDALVSFMCREKGKGRPVEHDELGRVEKDHNTAAGQQAEKDQAEKAEKEKGPNPADYAETDKELAQERGDAKERKSAQPRDTAHSPPDGAR